MPFREDAQQLIQQKKFDDVESIWMSQLDSDPGDVDAFLTVAKSLRKAEQRTSPTPSSASSQTPCESAGSGRDA